METWVLSSHLHCHRHLKSWIPDPLCISSSSLDGWSGVSDGQKQRLTTRLYWSCSALVLCKIQLGTACNKTLLSFITILLPFHFIKSFIKCKANEKDTASNMNRTHYCEILHIKKGLRGNYRLVAGHLPRNRLHFHYSLFSSICSTVLAILTLKKTSPNLLCSKCCQIIRMWKRKTCCNRLKRICCC